MKKVLLFLLTVVMSMSCVIPVFAVEDNPLEGLAEDKNQITVDKGEVTIVGLNDGNSNSSPGVSTQGQQKFWTSILTKYKSVITGIAAVCSLTFLLLFILNFTKLGQSSGNPQMRSQAIMGLIVTGIALACTGGIGLFFGFFYNALNGG